MGITHVQAWAKSKYAVYFKSSAYVANVIPGTTYPAYCQSAQLIFFPNSNLQAPGCQTSESDTTAGIGPKCKLKPGPDTTLPLAA